MRLQGHRRDWEDLADLDPLWAIASVPDKQHGAWDLQEFLETGRQEIAALMAHADLLGVPSRRYRALDFGCGIGRLTRPLAAHFDETVGVDISESMIDQARATNADIANCCFVVNQSDRLSCFSDGEFDLVYTNLVLQHLPSRAAVFSYVDEFVRILAPESLLVFQLPEWIPARLRIQHRRHIYRVLRAIGLSPRTLYKRMSLQPIRYNAVPQSTVRHFLAKAGAEVVDIRVDDWAASGRSATYYVTRPSGR